MKSVPFHTHPHTSTHIHTHTSTPPTPTHTHPHTSTPPTHIYPQSFLSDEDDGGGETSWEDTEQLTDPPGNGHVTSGDDHQTVFKNNAFEGETELADYGNHGDQGNRSAANTSHF